MKFHKEFIKQVKFNPDDFSIEPEYKDDFLYLTKEEYLLIKILGFDLLNIKGYLYLNYSNITELPDNLSVGGYLFLSYTNIIELPDNLSVGGNIYCDKEHLNYIPEKFKNKIYIDA